MRRREFLSIVGAVAAMWPLPPRAPPADQVRRVCLLVPFSARDPEVQAELAVFKKSLQEAGWTDGRNVRLEPHFTDVSAEQIRIAVAELIAAAPDGTFVLGTPTVGPLGKAPHTI